MTSAMSINPKNSMVSTVSSNPCASEARVGLSHIKRQGRLRQLRLRVPPMTTASIMILCIVAVTLSPLQKDDVMNCVATGLVPLAIVVYDLALLKSDRRLVRYSFAAISVFALLTAGKQGLNGVTNLSKGGGTADCSYKDEAAPCWLLTCVGALYVAMSLSTAVCGMYMVVQCCRNPKTELLHRRMRVSLGTASLYWSIVLSVKVVAFLIAGFTYAGAAYSSTVAQYMVGGILFLDNENRLQDLVQSWLMSRGEGAAAAAGVAEMLGGRTVEEVLKLARSHFLRVKANKITKEDMAENTPNPNLRQHTKPERLGSVDAFLSHSWSDSAELKWVALQEWIEGFKKEHGREPSFWIDKYCIDQNSIEESLACLPVFLAGCRKLVVLCGPTYLSRLWCLIEIMVFIEMGGDVNNLEVKLLEQGDFIQTFDPRNARCFSDDDTERLLSIIEVTGYDRISTLVRNVFG